MFVLMGQTLRGSKVNGAAVSTRWIQKSCQHLSHQPAAYETSIRLPVMLMKQEAADL